MSPESDSDVMVVATSAQDPNKFPSTSKDNNTTTSQSAAESSSELKSVEDSGHQDPPSLQPSTMETVLSEESEFTDGGTKRLSEQELENDVDNVANYIDPKKVVGKNESNYYYTPKNRSTRKTIEKIKKSNKGRAKEVDNLDTSQHARLSLLGQCKQRSSYFGPKYMRNDGSDVRGILKDKAYHIRRSSLLSGLSMASENDDADSKKRPSIKRSVSLASIHIREHERIAGDNPCVSSGVPLSIGWGSIQHDPIPIDAYETAKGPPRDKIEMMVPASVRRSLLRDEFKVPIADINAAMKSVNITKRNRAHTVASEHLEGWQEVAQSAKRKFKRLVNKTSTKQEEALLWEQAHKGATNSFLQKFGSGALGANPGDVDAGEIGVGPVVVAAADPPEEISIQSE